MESNGGIVGHEKKEVAATPQDPAIFLYMMQLPCRSDTGDH